MAAFDFDGTLTRGGSVWPFLTAVGGWPALARAALRLSPRLLAAGVFGGRCADRAKEDLFVRVLAGRTLDEVETVADRFGPAHFSAHARAEVVDRLAEHRRAGHRVVLVSASPELYLRPVGERLGVDAVLATRLAVDASGRLTGRYEGGNCRGSAKLARLRSWVASELGDDGTSPVVWAYGNSAGDAALLAGADVGVDVGRLGRWGRLRRFVRLRDAPRPTFAGERPAPVGPRPARPG